MTNTRSLTEGKLPGGNRSVASTEEGLVPAYKTKVSKGNRHVALGSTPDYATGLLWSLSVDNHPMHFGNAITGRGVDAYYQRFAADNEDANGLLPHQYTGPRAVPMDPMDIVAALDKDAA